MKTQIVQRDGEVLFGPFCSHGPTILFLRQIDNPSSKKSPNVYYFACSANRSRKQCQFFKQIKESQINQFVINQSVRVKVKGEDDGHGHDGGGHGGGTKREKEDDGDSDPDGPMRKSAKHKEKNKKNSKVFEQPIENNKGNAQYFFDDDSLSFLSDLATSSHVEMGKRKIICLGMPSLLGEIEKKLNNELPVESKSSIGIDDVDPVVVFEEKEDEPTNNSNNSTNSHCCHLLDIDKRFIDLYGEKYSWYNIGNNYFLDGGQNFDKFLKHNSLSTELIQIFIDPPFGMRLELLYNSLKQIVSKCMENVKNHTKESVEVYLINPYFMEGHIYKFFNSQEPNTSHDDSLGDYLQMTMSDFRITYKTKFKTSDVSTVRLYHSPWANMGESFKKFDELIKDEYKYCELCQKFAFRINRHCFKCKECTTKHGKFPYKHCNKCKKCVKSTYVHSPKENICKLKQN